LDALYRLARLLLFQLDPEVAHELVEHLLAGASRVAPTAGPSANGLSAADGARLGQTLWGLRFDSPVGLAAGLDKGRCVAPVWFWLGMGFVEIGTVTPRPQPGNPRPRLFRLPPHRALINRMGFNSEGAEAVAVRLRRLARQPGPVGINLGKNKDTPNERAAEDYCAALRLLGPLADYAAINVSSPNTPGLRALQAAEGLAVLVGAVVRERDALASGAPAAPGRRLPLLVKLSPDEPDDRLAEMARAAVDAGADGIIATNTTLDRAAVQGHPRADEAGGLSGAPLRDRALRCCAVIHRALQGRAPIIGVGGISSAEDAWARVRAGASLVQLYSALIYEGPGLARRVARGMARLAERDGLSLREAVGIDAARLGG
jgi:dihydroorotate dehydrogenase